MYSAPISEKSWLTYLNGTKQSIMAGAVRVINSLSSTVTVDPPYAGEPIKAGVF